MVFLTTESVFVLGFHDEMPFCFGGSRRVMRVMMRVMMSGDERVVMMG